MAHKHRYMKAKIGPFQELPHGRLPGQGIVPKEAYPEIVRRAKDECNAAIGRDYGVTGQTIGRIVRRAGQ
ncbi:hypothetical protein [Methanothrix sp.]|jgi:hypothetical protein|uniref:hypothetical protein n=1 Tax=Methanothrix sp. TaxID=90426 RepID=UPI0032AFFF0E